DFQKAYGLKQTGTANIATLQKIDELYKTPLQFGKRANKLVDLKHKLNYLGYGHISTTNYFGDYTVKKVKEFQKDHGLPRSGMIDPATEKKINSVFTNNYKLGGINDKIIDMKNKLNAIGFGHITVTNYYGSFTVQKVKDFQKAYGLKQTGTANIATLQKIDEVYKKNSNKDKTEYTSYRLTLKQALDIQMERLNITDKYKNDPAYISASYVNLSGGATINASVVNVRTKPNTTSSIPFQLKQGDSVDIVKEVKGTSVSGSTKWYEIKRNGKSYYVHSSLVSTSGKATVKATVNVRSKKSASSHIFGQITKGSSVTILEQGSSWHKIAYNTWRNAARNDVEQYLNPNKNDKMQHLRLDTSIKVSASQLNKVLKGKGTLSGQGQAFINATQK